MKSLGDRHNEVAASISSEPGSRFSAQQHHATCKTSRQTYVFFLRLLLAASHSDEDRFKQNSTDADT